MASNKENPRAPRVSMPILPSSNSSKNLGDTLSPRKLARRSLAPRKSILKFVNGPEDLIQDTDTADNTVQLSGDDRRKSLARRVSFAAHAQVRLYNKEAKTDNTSSPASAPQGSTPSDDSSKSNPSGGRKSSISSRRRSSAGQRRSISSNWEEEDSAMDIEEDEVTGIPPIYVAEHARHLYERSPAPSEDDDDEEDMEMTNVFGNGIVAAHTAPDDQSDTSVTQQPNTDVLEPDPPSPTHSTTTDRSEPMEFTVALEQSILPSRRASLANEAWAGLQALQHSHGGGGVQTSPTNDMNLADAMARMIAASPSNSNSQFATYREEDDSIFSDHSFREDQTMDFTSVVQSHLETPERSLIHPSHNPFLMDVPREEPALRVSQESIPSTQSSDPDAARPLPLNISVMSQPNPPTEPLVPRSESSPPRPISQNIPTFTSRLSTSTTNGPPIASPKRGSLFNSISIRRSSQNGTSSAPLNASTTTPTTPPGSPKRSSLGKRAASPLKSPASKKQVIGQDASKRKSVVVAAAPEEEVVTESESDSPEPADQSPEEPTQVTPTELATQEPVVQEPTPQEPPSVVENPPPRRASKE
ncbi:hypothetical protein FRC02_008038 [Tulasnella sp. 418]|nr:hypothetical protein FRC02_008038 [Tulasnella sp. 418]